MLADLNYAYFHFLTGHPSYRGRFGGLRWEELPEVLPILPEYGALELKTHPELGAEMDRDFCADERFFRNRPLYPGVIEVLEDLNRRGYRQFTMSATFDVEAKVAYLNEVLAPVRDFLTIECVRHGEFMHDTAKMDRLRECYEKYDLRADETILVDDRIYVASEEGTVYVLSASPERFSLLAEIVPLTLDNITPDEGGDEGAVGGSTGLSLLSHALADLSRVLGARLDPFALGPVSAAVAKELATLPQAGGQRSGAAAADAGGGSARGRYPRPLCPYHARNETWWQVPVL